MPSDFLVNRPRSCHRLVHWNIKELDSQKLQSPHHAQVTAAGDILAELQADILSLNEIHNDPARQKTLGRDNLQDFLQHWDRAHELKYSSLSPSNTGQRSNPSQKRIDRSNFGLFPGQYATGLASRFPIQKSLIVQALKWVEWQPQRDLANFFFGAASASEIELFDKSLSVQWLEIEGRSLAVVCLHAVPAFNFGQDKSPNAHRNHAQLQFLQWFLTGEPQPMPQVLARLHSLGLEPLAADQAFIAVGDLNSPLDDQRYPGGEIIQALLKHPRIHPRMAMIKDSVLQNGPKFNPTMSFFSEGWDYTQLPTQLDYMLVSRELKILNMQVIFANPDRQIHALRDPDDDPSLLLASLQKPGRRVSIMKGRAFGRMGQVAVVSVSEAFARLRAASDHLPLLLDFCWQESAKFPN
jgi:endonuclease/exonuclease/phosphatase family metal-dependent hydrolase